LDENIAAMMAATSTLDQRDADATAALELRALEKLIRARCEQIQGLANEAGARGGLHSRESELQLEAFRERSEKALQALETVSSESREIRIARLEDLAQALECSGDFFRAAIGSNAPAEAGAWAVRVR
jgi:hypothetical protein